MLDPQYLIPALIAVAIILLVSFPVHEFSHALVADRLGDHTARYMGRLTLDPRVHFDPLGGGILVLSAIVGGVFIGWAKPTPVNPNNLEGGHRGEALVALAGPASNLVMAALFAIAVRIVAALHLLHPYVGTLDAYIWLTLIDLVAINVFLFIFNLLPIPPLDGYKVLLGFVSPRTAWQLRQYEQYGFLLILVLFLFGSPIILPIGSAILNFLIGQPVY